MFQDFPTQPPYRYQFFGWLHLIFQPISLQKVSKCLVRSAASNKQGPVFPLRPYGAQLAQVLEKLAQQADNV